MSIIENAKKLATELHEGQVRKYSGEPYITHPKAVAKMVEMHGGDSNMIAAAWLHDTMEDCDATFEQIEDATNFKTAQYVLWLSDLSKSQHGNRKVRKRLDAMAMSLAPWQAKNVKLADIIDNSKSIMENDPEFAKVYLREKAYLLSVAMGDANQEMLAQAWAIILRGVGVTHIRAHGEWIRTPLEEITCRYTLPEYEGKL